MSSWNFQPVVPASADLLSGGGPSPALDDSDSAWAASQHGFVNVPLAGAAAALSLAVAIATGFNAARDDLPVTTTTTLVGHESVQIVAVGSEQIPRVFIYDDDIAPQAAPVALEEGEWRPPVFVSSKWHVPPFAAQDELPRRINEEYEWTPWIARKASVTQPVWATDEIVPQPPTFAPDETYEWVASRSRYYVAPPPSWTDEAIVPQAAAPSFEQGEWLYLEPVKHRALVSGPGWATDEIVPQPPAFVPDEDYWLQLTSDRDEVVIVDWEVTGGGGKVVVPTEPIAVEDYWLAPQWSLDKSHARIFLADDEIGTPPAALTVDETEWRTPIVVAARPFITVWTVADDLVAQPGDSPSSIFGLRARYTPEIKLWEFTDELPTPAAPTTVVESDWQVFTPVPVAPRVTLWTQGDDIAPQTPFVEDEYWSHFGAPLVLPRVTLWAENDEVPAAAVPLTIDENEWPSVVRLVIKPPVLPLYLPDPEELPAGFLIPLVVEIPQTDGAVWPLPKYPRRDREDIEREQRMVQRYLDDLDKKEKRLERAGEKARKPTARDKLKPRLSDAMALAASMEQLERVVRHELADEADRQKARAEFMRRYISRFVVLAGLVD